MKRSNTLKHTMEIEIISLKFADISTMRLSMTNIERKIRQTCVNQTVVLSCIHLDAIRPGLEMIVTTIAQMITIGAFIVNVCVVAFTFLHVS